MFVAHLGSGTAITQQLLPTWGKESQVPKANTSGRRRTKLLASTLNGV